MDCVVYILQINTTNYSKGIARVYKNKVIVTKLPKNTQKLHKNCLKITKMQEKTHFFDKIFGGYEKM